MGSKSCPSLTSLLKKRSSISLAKTIFYVTSYCLFAWSHIRQQKGLEGFYIHSSKEESVQHHRLTSVNKELLAVNNN